MHRYAIELWLRTVAEYNEATAQDDRLLEVRYSRAGYLNSNDDAPARRISWGGAMTSSEEAGFPLELSRPPRIAPTSDARTQNQVVSLGNSIPSTTRDHKRDTDRSAKYKLAIAIPAPASSWYHPNTPPSTVFSPLSTAFSSAATAKLDASESSAKTLADLAGVSNPPILLPLEANILPKEAQDLYKKLLRISKGLNLVPAAFKDRFEFSSGPLEPWEINDAPHALLSVGKVGHEMDIAQQICKKAHALTRDGHAAPGWNCDVHSPILDLALAGFDGVRPINIAAATLCPSLIPKPEVNSQVLQAKLVDYSINLVPNMSSPLADAIDAFIASQPFETRTVAPTMYDPVRRRPQGIAITTQALSSSSEPIVQLSIWAKATFIRYRQLLQSSPAAKTLDPPILPFVAVHGHEWDVWFGHDTADALELYGPLSIGCTKNLLKTWALVMSLRALGEWVDTDFRIWFEGAVGVSSGTIDNC